MNAREKITKARTGLLLDSPFFGSLALRLKLTENTEQRIYTDGSVLSYDPEMINEYTLNQVKGVLAHEVMHLAMAHHTRGKSFEWSTWNQAGDYAINGILKENRFELPEGILYDPAYKSESAESIYNKLYAKKQDSQDQDGNEQGKNGNGNGTPSQGNGNGQEQGNKESDPPKWGQMEQAKDPDKQEQEWKIAVQQAAQAQKSRGDIPGALQRIINEILNPVIDWRVLLKDFLDRTAKNDYNWSKPNTRYMQSGFILPSLISDELPELIVAIDTSGSITEAELSQVEPELQSIIDTYKTSIKVLYCDYHLYENNIQTFETGDTVKLEPIGRGGTSFIPVFEYIGKHESPTCLIYLTDMKGRFPDQEPEYPVLWIDSNKYSNNEPPFGEHIKMVQR